MELLGRDSELDAVVGRLRERRLVTVVGPGGIGKTALARTVAARLGDEYELGARFVDLTRTSSPEEVADVMAAQLEHPSFQALLDTPTDRGALVVLDNCEHVVTAAAETVDQLLAACEAPTVLATSRSPLDLPGEAVVILGPLELPPPGVVDPDRAAVRLFRDRARDAGVDVDTDLDAVCELCRRLDGLPLGVELAAARVRSLTPGEMLDQFDRQLDVVARPGRRGPARHRSLRDTIAWSHALLDDGDRSFFDRLSVFAGSFTRTQAHAVAGDDADDLATLDRLDRLVDASLLIVDSDAGTTRYRLLESLRTFAAEQLRGRGEFEATMDRFVAHAVEAARAVVASHDRPWEADVVAGLVGYLDNLVAATRWCIGHDDDPDRALLLVAVMWAVVHQARNAEIADVGERVLERWPDDSRPLWPDAAATVATVHHLLGRRTEAVELAERALAASGESVLAPVTLRRVLALTSRADGDVERALGLLREAADLARNVGAVGMALELDAFAAEAVADLGDPAAALEQLRNCRAEAARHGSTLIEAWSRTVEGHLLLRIDPSAATAVIGEAIATNRELGYHAGLGAALCGQACDRLLHDDLAGAVEATLELFDELATTGAVGLQRTGLEIAACVLRGLDRPAWRDVAAGAAAIPPRGGLPRELPPALRPPEPPDGDGRVPSAREAFKLARAELRSVEQGVERVAPAADHAAADRAVFRRAGELWEIEFAGRTANLQPSKGMDDLVRLLAEPGREFHCLDLAEAAVTESETGEVIDAEARRAYEQRIVDLQAELDEAEADHDLARAEQARVELDDLVEQLASAVGLGHRTRRSGSTAERARSAVTHRIRSTIRRIDEAHPRLGRHLRASVHTGNFCSYQPEQPITWET